MEKRLTDECLKMKNKIFNLDIFICIFILLSPTFMCDLLIAVFLHLKTVKNINFINIFQMFCSHYLVMESLIY